MKVDFRIQLPAVRVSQLLRTEKNFRIKNEDQAIIADTIPIDDAKVWFDKIPIAYPMLRTDELKRLEMILIAARHDRHKEKIQASGPEHQEATDTQSSPPVKEGDFDRWYRYHISNLFHVPSSMKHKHMSDATVTRMKKHGDNAHLKSIQSKDTKYDDLDNSQRNSSDVLYV